MSWYARTHWALHHQLHCERAPDRPLAMIGGLSKSRASFDERLAATSMMDRCDTQVIRVPGAATMETYRSLGKVGDDGILHLDIPVGVPNSEFEVVVVLQPRAGATQPEAPEDPGWPPGYFEQTAGSIQDPTFRCHDQGEFEKRLDETGLKWEDWQTTP